MLAHGEVIGEAVFDWAFLLVLGYISSVLEDWVSIGRRPALYAWIAAIALLLTLAEVIGIRPDLAGQGNPFDVSVALRGPRFIPSFIFALVFVARSNSARRNQRPSHPSNEPIVEQHDER